MRLRHMPILAIGTLGLVMTGSPAAKAQGGPWCAYYAAGLGGVNCRFVAYEQCMADLRGMGGWCELNRFYRAPDAAASKSRSGRRPPKRRPRPPE